MAIIDRARPVKVLWRCVRKVKQMRDRKDRATNRAGKLRGLIEQALTIADIKSHTLSPRGRRP